jgi:hypothetical protein
MKHFFSLSLVLFFLRMQAQLVAPADSLAPLSRQFPLLNNQAFISCPEGALFSPRPHKPLSPAPAEDQETRISWTNGSMHMVIFAQEMNAFGTPSLLQDVKSLYSVTEQSDYRFSPVIMAGKLAGVLTLPLRHDSSTEAILIHSILVQMPDSSLIQVGAYINPAAYGNLKAYQALSGRILSSITSGSRVLVSGPHKETLPVSGGIASLEISLPEHYIVLAEKGFDYISYQIRRIGPLTEHVPGGILLYTGLHPHLLAADYKFKAARAVAKETLILGKKARWLVYGDEARHVFLSEVLISVPECGPGVQIHLALLTSSSQEQGKLKTVATKLMFKK